MKYSLLRVLSSKYIFHCILLETYAKARKCL